MQLALVLISGLTKMVKEPPRRLAFGYAVPGISRLLKTSACALVAKFDCKVAPSLSGTLMLSGCARFTPYLRIVSVRQDAALANGLSNFGAAFSTTSTILTTSNDGIGSKYPSIRRASPLLPSRISSRSTYFSSPAVFPVSTTQPLRFSWEVTSQEEK